MRDIKFRAFDEMAGIMHNDFQFLKSGDEGNDWICFVSDKSPIMKSEPKVHPIVFDNPFFRQQLKVMQFTGLKDKNGKEIYEGDFLKCENPDAKYPEHLYDLCVIKWNSELAGFNLISTHTEQSFSHEDYGELEVVGNIHENSELFK